MKKLLFLLLFPILCTAQFGVRFPEKESFRVSAFFDPNASFKEKGLDFGAELEFITFGYVKIGFESFSALEGGYTDFHGAVGINMVFGVFSMTKEEVRVYTGVRCAEVFRNGGHMPVYGLEAGFDVNLTDNFNIGLRSTFDQRNDQEIMGWKPEWKLSGFVTIGYKWDFKGY